MNIKRGFGAFRRSEMSGSLKNDTLAATVAAKAEKLETQQVFHKRVRRNATSGYRSSLRVLKTRVGAYAVEHGLVVLSEAELEGAFIDLKDRMADAEIVAGWAESGERAAAERVEAKRSKTMFFVSVREPVSEAFRSELVAMGFRFSTRSLRYATIVAAQLPDGLVALAASNEQSVWTLDENADKVFVHQANDKGRVGASGVEGERVTEAAQSTMFSGRMRNKASLEPASQDGANSVEIGQDSEPSG